ncbi:MAG TPA: NTP transferase domain-containing protein [Gemmatimonadaceae bacterium]|nr:NTP transferase domain-containing protein [Gemmatimonadaceae bacterium]
MTEAYSSLVLEHFRRPRNRGRHPRANASAEGANPLCGDRIRIECEVSGARVVSIMFTGDACAICVASASLLSGRVEAMAIPDVMAMPDDEVVGWLEGAVPPARRRCATLPLDTLRHALTPLVPVSIVRPVILAAGAGRRFGGDKLLALVDGEPMIRIVAGAYAELCGRATVVVSRDARLAAALEGLPVDIVVNAGADEGIASSIRAGIAGNAHRPAVMIALADEPRVDRPLVMKVMQLWHERRAPIVVPRYNGEPGHPVLFDQAIYGDLLELKGDRGAKGLIDRLGDAVLSVDVEQPRPIDIDRPEDLDRLAAGGAE